MGQRCVPLALSVVLLGAGCARPADPPTAAASLPGEVSESDDAQGGVVGPAAARARKTGVVDCAGSRYDPDDLAEAPAADTLPDGPAGAVDDAGDPAFDPSLNWKVVHQSEDRVDLVRELKKAEGLGPDEQGAYQRVTLERIVGATNIRDGTWLLTVDGFCTPRLVADDGLGEADLSLARQPSPDAAFIELLVLERACASGQSAEGRIELRDLEVTETQVRVWIGVRPAEGGQDCQGNPQTPFTVELAEPLGDRTVVDAGVVPPQRLTVDRGQ